MVVAVVEQRGFEANIIPQNKGLFFFQLKSTDIVSKCP